MQCFLFEGEDLPSTQFIKIIKCLDIFLVNFQIIKMNKKILNYTYIFSLISRPQNI